jgi:hypothetical protein
MVDFVTIFWPIDYFGLTNISILIDMIIWSAILALAFLTKIYLGCFSFNVGLF